MTKIQGQSKIAVITVVHPACAGRAHFKQIADELECPYLSDSEMRAIAEKFDSVDYAFKVWALRHTARPMIMIDRLVTNGARLHAIVSLLKCRGFATRVVWLDHAACDPDEKLSTAEVYFDAMAPDIERAIESIGIETLRFDPAGISFTNISVRVVNFAENGIIPKIEKSSLPTAVAEKPMAPTPRRKAPLPLPSFLHGLVPTS